MAMIRGHVMRTLAHGEQVRNRAMAEEAYQTT